MRLTFANASLDLVLKNFGEGSANANPFSYYCCLTQVSLVQVDPIVTRFTVTCYRWLGPFTHQAFVFEEFAVQTSAPQLS